MVSLGQVAAILIVLLFVFLGAAALLQDAIVAAWRRVQGRPTGPGTDRAEDPKR